MNETSNPRVTYWLVFGALVAAVVDVGMWKRMSDGDRRKVFFG